MRLILLISLSIFLLKNIEAQSNFGIKAGVNYAQLSGESVASQSSRIGARTGIYWNRTVFNSFLLQFELLYSQQGNADLLYDYVVFPALLKVDLAENINLQLGGEVSFLTNAKMKAASGNTDIRDEIQSFDVPAVLGVGLKFGKLDIDVRGHFGSIDTYVGGGSNLAGKNSFVSITAGYFFRKNEMSEEPEN